MLSREVSEFLSKFSSGTHAVVFYDDLEKKREILFSHLKFGERNQGLAYVCSEESPQQIREQMKRFGIDADRLRTSGRLGISNYDEIYIVDQKVNVARIATAFSEMAEKYRLMGLEGLRASAEMSCFFREGKIKDLLMYEYSLHRRFGFQAEGICAYNIHDMERSGHLETIMPVIRAHETVILAGPNASVVLEPHNIEDKDFEKAMEIEIKI